MSRQGVKFNQIAKAAKQGSGSALVEAAQQEAMKAVHGFDSLTQRQQALLTEYWRTGDVEAAWRSSGFTSRAEAELSLGSDKVSRVLRRQRQNRLNSLDAEQARRTMVELMAPTVAASTRFQAAKWILEEAGHNAKAADQGEKPLGEMTPSELLAFVNQQRGIVEAGGAKGVTIDVIPADIDVSQGV